VNNFHFNKAYSTIQEYFAAKRRGEILNIIEDIAEIIAKKR